MEELLKPSTAELRVLDHNVGCGWIDGDRKIDMIDRIATLRTYLQS
jgi:hypothetical protein